MPPRREVPLRVQRAVFGFVFWGWPPGLNVNPPIRRWVGFLAFSVEVRIPQRAGARCVYRPGMAWRAVPGSRPGIIGEADLGRDSAAVHVDFVCVGRGIERDVSVEEGEFENADQDQTVSVYSPGTVHTAVNCHHGEGVVAAIGAAPSILFFSRHQAMPFFLLLRDLHRSSLLWMSTVR